MYALHFMCSLVKSMIAGPASSLPIPWKYWINASMLSTTVNKQQQKITTNYHKSLTEKLGYYLAGIIDLSSYKLIID